MTDELFAYHPRTALDYLKGFIKDTEFKTVKWKIVARPGLKNWLQELVHEHEKEILEKKDIT